MNKIINKEKLKGAAIGFTSAALLFTGAVYLNANQTFQRQVTYGVRVSLDGSVLSFDEDATPFVSEGRTFLPVRGISEALGLEVGWDGDTQTVILTSEGGPQLETLTPVVPVLEFQPLLVAYPQPDMRHSSGFNRNNIADGGSTITIGTRSFPNSIPVHSANGETVSFSLQGNYTQFTAYAGATDFAHTTARDENQGSFRIFGDGNLLAEVSFYYADGPQLVTADLTGVNNLTIEVNSNGLRIGLGTPLIR